MLHTTSTLLSLLDVSLTKMLHRHQHCCHYKIDVSLAKMLHILYINNCCHYKIYVSLANMLHMTSTLLSL